MPDTLMTTGVSLGLLAGIVSGVCYVIANGINWPRSEDRKRCLPPSDEGICRRCGGDYHGGALPCICVADTPRTKFRKGGWFLQQLQRAGTLMPWSLSTDKLEQIDEECEGSASPEGGGSGDLRSVREFLEALSAKLAGGPLEGTRVAPLYHHPAYESMFDRHHADMRDTLASLANALRDALIHLPHGESASSATSVAPSNASTAHAQLKRLVARVVEEAAALPALARYAAEPPRSPSVEASTYEDLLATAILNKVIERYQTENGSGGRSSGIHSASASPTPSERSSPRSLHLRHPRDITPPLLEDDEEDASDWEGGVDDLELPRRVPFPEYGGDIIHAGDSGDQFFDDVSGSDIQAIDGSWEENWLFQKKKIKTLQSVPVPMLVPNSNAEYRAMIGDRDADDTTDLSDNASDAEEEQTEFKSDVKRILDSKHLIGGKSKVEEQFDFEPDSLTMLDGVAEFDEEDLDDDDNKVNDAVNGEVDGRMNSKIKDTVDTINKDLVKNMENGNDSILFYGIDSGPLPKTEFSVKEEIHRTFMHMNGNENDIDVVDGVEKSVDTNKVDVKNDYQKNREFTQNTLNGHEREGEYEETVTVPVQRYADSLRRKHFDEEPQTIPTRDTDKEDELIPGSIAYRERKKWLNYVEMPNNPYSPEAIQKRLTAKSASSLFDMLTKSKDVEEDKDESKDTVHITENVYKKLDEVPVKEDVNRNRPELTVITEHVHSQGNNREASLSPRILKEVLVEEIPQYKRYGRDYYIKEARASSGGRKKSSFSDTSSLSSMHKSTSLDNFETEFASTGLLIKQFNSIATNQQYTSFTNNEPQQSITITSDSNNTKNILIEYEDVDEQTLFSAKPVYIDDDTDKKFDEILESAYERAFSTVNIEVEDKEQIIVASPISSNHNDSILSSSSLEDSIKIYNVQTGEIVKCKPDNVSQRYDSKPDRNDNIDITDKNTEENLSDIASTATDEGDDVFVNIKENSVEPTLEIIDEFEEIQLPKVKELAKKFVSMDSLNEEDSKPPPQMYSRKKSRENLLNGSDKSTKQMYMHSLTARSITKEFREELKHSMATPLKTPGGTKELPEGIEEVTKEVDRPSSPVPVPGTLKIKLAFFESLKAKLSSK